MRRLVAALVLLAACSTPSPTPPPVPQSVIVGDSIGFSLATDPEARGYLPSNMVWDVDPGRAIVRPGFGKPKIGLDAVIDAVPFVAFGGWLVIQLGTNDLGDDPKYYDARIEAVLDAVPSNVCVAWVLPYDADRPTRWPFFDSLVVQHLFTPAHPCHELVDWPGMIGQTYGTILADNVHPNAVGRIVLAKRLADIGL